MLDHQDGIARFDKVIEYFQQHFDVSVEEVILTREDVVFKLPKVLSAV